MTRVYLRCMLVYFVDCDISSYVEKRIFNLSPVNQRRQDGAKIIIESKKGEREKMKMK